MTSLATHVLRLARALLPEDQRSWADAAAGEAGFIQRPFEALLFALGFLGWATRAALARRFLTPHETGRDDMGLSDQLRGPRGRALLFAVVATGLGLAYLFAAGAPARYLMINAGALAFGVVALGLLGLADDRRHLPAGAMNLLLGLMLVAVSIWGASVGGITRWVALGPLMIQPSLMFVPLMAVLFARSPGWVSAAGVGLAALAMALQPDRAMAGSLAAGMIVLALTRPGLTSLAAALLSTAGFGAAMVQADPSPAVPFVDQILYSSFSIHPLAGLAVLAGSALLLGPALTAWRGRSTNPAPYVVFGAVWAAVVAAAALGNHPTPLVGYSGSAVIGYLLSLVVFPRQAADVVEQPSQASARGDVDETAALYVAAR